jgi:hypothetical protein
MLGDAMRESNHASMVFSSNDPMRFLMLQSKVDARAARRIGAIQDHPTDLNRYRA